MIKLKEKKDKGITIISLIITVIVLLILAAISIITLQGNNGNIQNAIDSQVETELAQLQEKLNRYKAQNEAERINSGDYSGEMTNTDLAEEGIIEEVYVRDTGKTIGIIYIDKLGEKSNLGNSANDIYVEEIESMSELNDVFVIEYGTNDIYYVRGEESWKREGEAGISEERAESLEKGPKITVTPNEFEGGGTVEVEINIEERENPLKEGNEYEYYVSSKGDDLEEGEWREYKEGEKYEIGMEDLLGEYYIFVKEVEDEKGIKSTGGKTVIINGQRYHRYGPYRLLMEYTIEYELEGGIVEGNPTVYTVITETFTLKNPTKEGYTFIGWTGSNGDVPEKEITIEQGSTGNRVYKANWERNKYIVTYDYATNGGNSSTKTSEEVYYGDDIDLTPTATKTGYTFVGWNTNKDATVGLTSMKMGVSNVTLYAIYKDTTSPTVSFSINGGTFAKPTSGNATVRTQVTASDSGSGVSTVQYVWSTSTTQPTSGWTTFTNGTSIPKTDCAVGNYYLWIRATDNAGNTNITRSNAFSIINATITITASTTSWTNSNVTGTVAYSNSILVNRKAGYGSTLAAAQSNASTSTSTRVVASANGYFYAEATDSMGNKVYRSLQITTIDKTSPTKPGVREQLTGSSVLVRFTPTDNTNGSGIDRVTASSGDLTVSGTQYTLTLSTSGTSTVTIYDKAGNTVSFKYSVQFFAKQYDQCTSVTGGWSQNYFRNAYGDIPGIVYQYADGTFAISATPYSGYGRVGTWYTNNSINLSSWQYIHTVSSLDVSSTGTWNLWLDGAQVDSKSFSDGEYNNDTSRWIRLDYTIQSGDGSKQIIIGSNGSDTQTILGYFLAGCLSKIE